MAQDDERSEIQVIPALILKLSKGNYRRLACSAIPTLLLADEQHDSNAQGKPLNDEGVRGQFFCPMKLGQQPTNANSHKNKRGQHESAQREEAYDLGHMIVGKQKQTQANRRIHTETQEKF